MLSVSEKVSIDPANEETRKQYSVKTKRLKVLIIEIFHFLGCVTPRLLRSSDSIALLRALATSKARAQQRAAQLRGFLNAYHGLAAAAAQVLPESPESESDHDHEKPEPELTRRPECPGFEDIDYESIRENRARKARVPV
ncbi:hypothetical protein STEG23_034116 [Scotinomys teguina]